MNLESVIWCIASKIACTLPMTLVMMDTLGDWRGRMGVQPLGL
jgi:hypothetical protein